jgi:hypothetical protein
VVNTEFFQPVLQRGPWYTQECRCTLFTAQSAVGARKHRFDMLPLCRRQTVLSDARIRLV